MTAPALLKLAGSSRSARGTPAKVASGPYILPSLMRRRLQASPGRRQVFQAIVAITSRTISSVVPG